MFLAESSIQLVPDGTLLLHLLLIGIMVAVLNRTLLRPINQILSEREKRIQGRMSEAQAMAATVDEKLREYNATLRDARADGYRLLEKERAEAVKERDEQLRIFKEEMSGLVSAQVEEVRRQDERVRRELESQATSLSELIASQILSRTTR